MSKFWYVGIVGLANLSVLALLAILLFAYFVISSNTTEVFNRGSFRKKVAVYLLLALSVLAELPMYVGFITDNEYVKGYFGLHKLQSALLFSAFSIIIRDWVKVLYDNKDYPLLFSRVSLVFINTSYLGVSVFSCIYLWVARDIDSFVYSPMYIIVMFAEIVVGLVLAAMMLHAGRQLSARIQGAVSYQRSTVGTLADGLINDDRIEDSAQRGSFVEYNVESKQSEAPVVHGPLTARQVGRSTSLTDGSSTFKNALNVLNIVMIIQLFCISCQALLLLLNYSLGYATNDNTVGPYMFYWTFSSWIPQWGMVMSLLYLMRSGIRPKNRADNDPQLTSQRTLSRQVKSTRSDMDMDVSVTIDDDPPYIPPVRAPSSGWRDTNDVESKSSYTPAMAARSIQSPEALLNIRLSTVDGKLVEENRGSDTQNPTRSDDRAAYYSDYSMRTRISASQVSDIDESVRSGSRSSMTSVLLTAATPSSSGLKKDVPLDSNLWER